MHSHFTQTTLFPTTWILQNRGQQCPEKGQTVSISGFVGHVVSVATTQLCRSPESSQRPCIQEWGSCVPIKLYLEAQEVGCTRPLG